MNKSHGQYTLTGVVGLYIVRVGTGDKLFFGRQRQTLCSLHAPDYGSENEHSASPLPRLGTNSLTMSVLFAIPTRSRRN